MSEPESKNFEFHVGMSCSGCSGAVERNLKKLEGVESYDVSLEAGTVKVQTAPGVTYQTVLQSIGKTGKKITAATELVDGKAVTRDVTLPPPA